MTSTATYRYYYPYLVRTYTYEENVILELSILVIIINFRDVQVKARDWLKKCVDRPCIEIIQITLHTQQAAAQSSRPFSPPLLTKAPPQTGVRRLPYRKVLFKDAGISCETGELLKRFCFCLADASWFEIAQTRAARAILLLFFHFFIFFKCGGGGAFFRGFLFSQRCLRVAVVLYATATAPPQLLAGVLLCTANLFLYRVQTVRKPERTLRLFESRGGLQQ